jgi:hypothetical protein
MSGTDEDEARNDDEYDEKDEAEKYEVPEERRVSLGRR